MSVPGTGGTMTDTSDQHRPKATRHSLFKRRRAIEQELHAAHSEVLATQRQLAETTKALSLLRTIDAIVLEPHASLKLVCTHIAEAITQANGYSFVGVLTRTSHTRQDVTLQGWAGAVWHGKTDHSLGISHPLHVKTDHDWFTQPLSTLKVPFEELSDALLAETLRCSEAEVRRFRRTVPVKSMYVVKLLARRRLVGLLVVGYQSPVTSLTQQDTTLIDQLADSVGVALDNKLLFEENQSVLRQLRDSNDKLRELDEAKDDFISMASHQLRTPLTSVKGYISMIKEGDAGHITPQQKQMLEQAFFSSQRMVYLIADLLNVSRLRTGKFVIESTPVDIAQIVNEEIEQLIEIAKSRQLTLEYHKPKTDKKPTLLMLDEVKTRQIIMNFVDNAIYYTPADGHITVELIDKPNSIELRVSDDGIGVPHSEQPHLFTKFYRAGNARKVRPDGTGLGLFMAKKVIVAQHGSLIFQSKEGEGSTFGFIFSKHKLAVSDAHSTN